VMSLSEGKLSLHHGRTEKGRKVNIRVKWWLGQVLSVEFLLVLVLILLIQMGFDLTHTYMHTILYESAKREQVDLQDVVDVRIVGSWRTCEVTSCRS
jgi:hypothetical protein